MPLRAEVSGALGLRDQSKPISGKSEVAVLELAAAKGNCHDGLPVACNSDAFSQSA